MRLSPIPHYSSMSRTHPQARVLFSNPWFPGEGTDKVLFFISILPALSSPPFPCLACAFDLAEAFPFSGQLRFAIMAFGQLHFSFPPFSSKHVNFPFLPCLGPPTTGRCRPPVFLTEEIFVWAFRFCECDCLSPLGHFRADENRFGPFVFGKTLSVSCSTAAIQSFFFGFCT